jgi:hypothetical protein
MALVLNDRVKETTATNGTGTIDLAGAETGFETFVAGVGNTNTTYYAIVHQAADEFEVGLGTVSDSTPDTLSRTTIISSSNSDSAVNFSAGTKDVFCTLPASKAVFADASDNVGIGLTNPSSPLHVRVGTNNNFEIEETGGDLRLLAINDARDTNVPMEFAASKFEFLTGKVGIGTNGSTLQSPLHVAGAQSDVYGQVYVYGSGSNNDPQIAMGSSTNGRGFYLDDSDTNRFKIYTGHGKGASSGAYEFVLDNSGTIESKRTYNNTTAYSANMYVHTDGSFNRSTSSRRYKKDIVDATKGLDEILQLKPRNYKPKNDRTDSTGLNEEINDPHLDAADRTFAGFIAEEIHDLGLTEYVDYEADGKTPSGLFYGNMVALLVKGIQDQQVIIDDLKARIETLEG